MFKSKMDKKIRIVRTWSPTATLRAMKAGTMLSLPFRMLSSPQAMYMAKLRLNTECEWEQWKVSITKELDANGFLRKRVVVERLARKPSSTTAVAKSDK